MKKNILLLIIAIIFFPKINTACTCASQLSFCEMVTDENGDLLPLLIFRGELIEGINIKVNQKIHGDISLGEISFTVHQCTNFYGDFEVGKEYIFALGNTGDGYFALSCGIWYLEIEDEVVKGNITPEIESIDYHNLSSLSECGNGFGFFNVENDLDLFPNPTTANVKIANTNLTLGSEQINLNIYDLVGRKIQSFIRPEGILPESFWVIDIENYPIGLYLFEFVAIDQRKTFKIVKQ